MEHCKMILFFSLYYFLIICSLVFSFAVNFKLLQSPLNTNVKRGHNCTCSKMQFICLKVVGLLRGSLESSLSKSLLFDTLVPLMPILVWGSWVPMDHSLETLSNQEDGTRPNLLSLFLSLRVIACYAESWKSYFAMFWLFQGKGQIGWLTVTSNTLFITGE